MEAVSYAKVTIQVVARFIRKEIIFHYGVPKKINTDNESNLHNKMMKELCRSFKIDHHNSLPYRPKMNGVVEAANKNIKKILQKMVETYKDWKNMLPFAFTAIIPQYALPLGKIPYVSYMAWMQSCLLK